MGLIHSFSVDGEFDIDSILLKEGFEKKEQDYLQKILARNGYISILVTTTFFLCELKNNQDEVVLRSQINYRPDCFFERYAMVLEQIKDFLNQ